MAIVAPLSKFKKNGFKMYIVACLVLGGIFAYDGYLSQYEWSHRQSFYEKHAKDGQPDDTMKFNKRAPFVLVVLAGIFLWRLQASKDRRLQADEKGLIIDGNKKIPYASIEKIDKTHFQSKGHFIITYKKQDGRKASEKISDRTYDNLEPILEKLVAEIS